MAIQTATDLLNLAKATTTEATIDSLGQTVSIQEISGAALDYVRGSAKGGGVNERGMMARLIIAGVVNEKGEQLFMPADEAKVNAMPFKVIQEMAEAVQEANGMSAPEEVEGN